MDVNGRGGGLGILEMEREMEGGGSGYVRMIGEQAG